MRKYQDDEDAAKEKESKKVKREAQLFKRHWKEAEARLKVKQKQEEEKRQEAYLEKLFQERQAQAADMESDERDDVDWDPIEDVIEDERNDYVDLMKRLLWLASDLDVDHEDEAGKEPKPEIAIARSNADTKTVNENEITGSSTVEDLNREKRARKKARAKARAQEKAADDIRQDSTSSHASPGFEVNESQDDMRQRLIHGEEFGKRIPREGMALAWLISEPPSSRWSSFQV